MSRRSRAALVALAASIVPAGPAAAEVPAGAVWTEHYIADALPYPAGQPKLHADLMLPEDHAGEKLPVIVSVGPYFAHGGSSLPGQSPNNDGPQLRWKDLIQEGRLFERGYGLLQVDLRGFGGSQGCNDFGGRGEQIDVKRAVEWAVRQPWSNGRVAIYGKSYDGWTGVMALDEKPQGLAAAVIQSPIIDGYRTLYQDGVHYGSGWYGTPALYQAIDATPPAVPDVLKGRTDYIAGWATGTDPACYARNIALQNGLQKRDDAAAFWRERDLPAARGSAVPTFWSHGFLDVNTKPDNFVDVWSTLEGDTRGWFGQFAHTRPNEPGVGRSDYYFEELFDFLGEHLRGDERVEHPTVEVEDNEGRWRAERQWPPADGVERSVELRSGTYNDRQVVAGAENLTNGVWSVTAPLDRDAWIAGVPTAKVDVTTTLPDANVIVRVYDVRPSGQAQLVTRGAGKAAAPGATAKRVELYPADHVVRAGHRLAVYVTAYDSLYLPPPSGQTVTVRGGKLEAPFLRNKRTAFLPGAGSSEGSGRVKATIPAATLEGNPTTWEEPPALSKRRAPRRR